MTDRHINPDPIAACIAVARSIGERVKAPHICQSQNRHHCLANTVFGALAIQSKKHGIIDYGKTGVYWLTAKTGRENSWLNHRKEIVALWNQRYLDAFCRRRSHIGIQFTFHNARNIDNAFIMWSVIIEMMTKHFVTLHNMSYCWVHWRVYSFHW